MTLSPALSTGDSNFAGLIDHGVIDCTQNDLPEGLVGFWTDLAVKNGGSGWIGARGWA